MKKIQIYINIITFCLLASCVSNPYIGKYDLNESYAQAKPKIDQYYRSQVRSFGLFQDKKTFEINETNPGSNTRYSLTKWAPDIGTKLLHTSELKKTSNSTSSFTVNAKPEGEGTGSPQSRVEGFDKWIMPNLNVKNRDIRELVKEQE